MKPQIVIVTGVYPPEIGGPAKFCKAFSDWLTRKEFPNTVLTLTDGNDLIFEKEVHKQILISRRRYLFERMVRTIMFAWKQSSTSVFLVNGLFIEFSFLTFLKQINFVAKIPGDIVWERCLNQGKTQLSVSDYQGNEDVGKRVMRYFFVRTLKKARIVIVPSAFLKQLAINWGVPESKIVVLQNSADLNIFSPHVSEQKIYDLVTVGRLIKLKGVEELIEVSRSLNMSLAIVGTGPEYDSLQTFAAKNDIDVNFLGELRPVEVAQILSKSSFFVLNSSHEGSPHALIEALASGVVSIARKNTGTVEIIEHGYTGFLFDSGDQLIQILQNLKRDSMLCQRISENASFYAKERFDESTVFQSIYELLIGKT